MAWARGIHADLAVVIHRHERERRIDHGVDDSDVQLVEGVDRLPIGSRSPAQWIHAECETGPADGVRVDDILEIFDIGQHQIDFVGGDGLDRRREGYPFDAGIARAQQDVRSALNPPGHVGIGRTTVGWVVLETAVLGRVVRRRNDDAVREVLVAAAVIDQDRPRDDRRRRDTPIALNDRLDAVGG